MKKVYGSSEESGAPLSEAHEVNGLVFVSGQVHIDSELNLLGNTIEEKLEVVMGNVNRILAEADLSLKDVIRVHIYVTDINDLKGLNAVYGNYFAHPLPARTAVCVKELPLGASLEMDVIAAK